MQFGIWKVHILQAGYFRLDGGAMFGTVPKVLWQKLMPPDEDNRCRFANNALLLRGEVNGRTHNVLIETGNGDKEDERFRERLAMEGRNILIQNLSNLGLAPEDITEVVFSHLHFDHAGGGTCVREGRILPTFPNARYYVQKAELEEAHNPSPRTKASYIKTNWEPLLEAGLLHTVDGEAEILPHLNVRPLPGHNRGNQGIFIGEAGKRLVLPGDLIPTRHHLNPTWCMGYDLHVERCVGERQKLLEELSETKDQIIFGHDTEQCMGRVEKGEKGFRLVEN